MTNFIDITEEHKETYNSSVSHPLQSWQWGEFRKKTGIQIVRRGIVSGKKVADAYTMTLHKVPHLPYAIGYLPKGMFPNKELVDDITEQAKKNNCVYVQLEPDVPASQETSDSIRNLKLEIRNSIRPSFHPLFTKYTFILDLTPSEETLFSKMHPKTRYNIRLAQKHNVEIIEDNSEKGFETFLKLYNETTNRQRFYAHTSSYHRILWETLHQTMNHEPKTKNLSYHLLHAKLGNETLTSWVFFSFGDTLYYPYGASSREHREAMASNLIMWEGVRLGKKMGLLKFDMWGALGPEPDTKDPWYGFHKFKQGYGATLTEFAGSYDLIINPMMYEVLKIGDKLRWGLLRLKKKL